MADVDPFASATTLLGALRTGQVSAAELTELYIRRIERHDGRLNAVVVRDFERARQQARAADQAAGPHESTPLLGPADHAQGVHQRHRARHDLRRARLEGLRLAARRARRRAHPRRRARCCSARPTCRPCSPTGSPPTRSTGAPAIPGTRAARRAGAAAAARRRSRPDSPRSKSARTSAGSIRVPAVFCGVYGHRPSETLLPRSGQFPMPPLPNAGRRDGRAGPARAQRGGSRAGALGAGRPRRGRGRGVDGRAAAGAPRAPRRLPRGGAAADPVASGGRADRGGARRTWPPASATLGCAGQGGRSPRASATTASTTASTARCSPR